MQHVYHYSHLPKVHNPDIIQKEIARFAIAFGTDKKLEKSSALAFSYRSIDINIDGLPFAFGVKQDVSSDTASRGLADFLIYQTSIERNVVFVGDFDKYPIVS